MEPPMTVKELSDYLRLDRMTIYKMLKEGSIPASRIGHQWRFFRDDIDQWIRSLSSGQRTSILVAEGQSSIAQVFESELSSDDYEVVVVPTNEEALTMALSRQFDVAFLELRKSAIESFKQMRDNDDSLAIVLTVVNFDGRLAEQIIDMGPCSLVNKPRSADEIISILNTLYIPKSAGL